MGVGGMDTVFDVFVVHKTVKDITGYPFRSTYYGIIEKSISPIYKTTGRDPFSIAEIFI